MPKYSNCVGSSKKDALFVVNKLIKRCELDDTSFCRFCTIQSSASARAIATNELAFVGRYVKNAYVAPYSGCPKAISTRSIRDNLCRVDCNTRANSRQKHADSIGRSDSGGR